MREQTGNGRQVFVSTHERPDQRDTPVIDLDATREQPACPDPDGQRHGWQALRSRQVSLPLVLALLLGTAAAAAVGTYRWQARHQRLAEESAASVYVLAQAEIAGVERDGPLARIKSSVIVANTGPLPVEVTDIQAVEGSLALSAVGPDVVRPGLRSFAAWVTVDCTTPVPNESVPVVISVRPADGKPRDLTYQVPPRPWQYAYESVCLPPPQLRVVRVPAQ
ncbi:hypothetical protein [Micromonospora narathiwatensis]|uniref:hypothetical protein n=1 Tax=Micromonospora narathiwatensis TaxID=299146 RepID=UPI0012FD6AA3|nr:hypothetical protein [Micromonospora narathiwatensis]